MAGAILNKVVQEVSARTNIKKELLEYLFLHETKNILKLNRQDIQRLQERKNKGVFYIATGYNQMHIAH